ncbi:MAG: YceI family protein [Bacteroidota bacterium]
MNTRLFLFSVCAAVVLAACTPSESEKAVDAKEAGEAAVAAVTAETYMVQSEATTLNWKGSKKVGDDEHYGTIMVSDGSMNVEGGNLTAGTFTIDMSSIKNVDIEDAEYNAKLVGHLAGTDFFDVATYPTAKFEITEVTATENDTTGATHMISGNLTIKATTKQITIPAKVSMEGGMFKAMSNFAVNRADFDVQYGSETFFDDLADKVINDDIEFDLTLVAAKAEGA